MEPPYTDKDREIALKVFQRAIEYFKIPDEPTPEAAKEFLREDGTLDWDRVPLITVRRWENGEKLLNLAFFYSDILVVLADYNPLVAILDFLDEARKLIKSRFPRWEDEKIEQHSELETFKMTLSLFSRIYPRMNLAMQSFTVEVIHSWFIEWRKWEAQVYSESGIKPVTVSETKVLRGLLKEHEDDLLKLWLNAPDRKSDEKKMQLAKEYPAILNHWKNLRLWCRSGNADWRVYAKPEKFSDTPDDLLDKLENSDPEKTSFLALEHAARRSRLLKLSQDDKILEKRAQKIRMTGYTPRQLQNFLDEGKKLLDEMHAQTAFHPKDETVEPDKSS